MVERVTITIKPDILRKLDEMIDGKAIRNRSHAVEQLLLKYLGKIDTALILAGGSKKIKSLISIHGKPVLEHQINMLKKYNINNILLSIDHGYDKIRDYFGSSFSGVNITYLVEDQPLGSAGSISLARAYVNDTFVALNVDTLINPNIPEIYDFHKKQGRVATVILLTTDDPTAFGVVKMSGNRILEFIEKPKIANAPSRLVNGGLCIFEPQIFDLLPKGKLMIESLFDNLAREGQLSGYVHDGMIFDVGKEYDKAEKHWKDIS
ncbi:MAG: sugar phosphate nucleotidyltransferase [Candidatus Aenigmarchaeota archaeon]|nr:sugar phosphate nucleotidyltransferase [Candidatus Aenigmarchaeota archaeon]